MKHFLLVLLAVLTFNGIQAQEQTATYSISPTNFDATDEITVTISDIDPSLWDVSEVYIWLWHYNLNDENPQDSPTNGSWTNSNEAQKMTANDDGTFSFSFMPSELYGTTDIGSIGMLAKAKDATGNKKTQDNIVEVGTFDLDLNSPSENITILQPGDAFSISANTSTNADFELFANGNSIDSQSNSTAYSYSTTITSNTDYELVATSNDGIEIIKTFSAYINETPNQAPVPSGLEDGINYDAADPNQISLVLYAPNKESVQVIGNFNNWQVDNSYVMNYDADQQKYWITIDNLDPDLNAILFQYVVDSQIKIADPYSTLILSPYNDDFIPNSYFNELPAYPEGQTEEAVSWVRKNAPEYNWNNTDFQAPEKENLMIYELLVRDFDDGQNFQDVINRLDYLENLGINAIELMPVSEFDGNLSWGYNPSFHMALDKYYGSPEMLKQLVDQCHSRGIAVILDVVYNQATGQNPLFRMYNNCNGCTGGTPSADSPYFNENARHAYNVFNDFNHQSEATQMYVKKSFRYWMNEFKIDGFRWDLTKGFTQNCSIDDEACTNSYQADRVEVLKDYADAQWETDDDFIIIFEHLGNGGSAEEETEFANYRLDEGKGILFWDIYTFQYNQATMGYDNSDFSTISWLNRDINAPRNIGYMESHDEERLMYKNLAFGNSNDNYDVTELPTALDRMKAAGAFFFTVPGPKMIWQFGELGYDISIFTCEDGTIPDPYGTPDCKLAEKPDGWGFLNDPERVGLHDTWQKMIALRQNEAIFSTSDFTVNVNNDALKSIHLNYSDASEEDIQFVTIIGNLGMTEQSINPEFQQTGTWYNLLDNSSIEVNTTTETISLAPGEFYIYGDKTSSLSLKTKSKNTSLKLYPNPSTGYFSLTGSAQKIEVYDVAGTLRKTYNQVHQNDKLNTETLSPGLYFLKIKTKQGIRIKRLIVNN